MRSRMVCARQLEPGPQGVEASSGGACLYHLPESRAVGSGIFSLGFDRFVASNISLLHHCATRPLRFRSRRSPDRYFISGVAPGGWHDIPRILGFPDLQTCPTTAAMTMAVLGESTPF